MSGVPFLFVGDQLALDFVNTVITAKGAKQRDLIENPRALEAWRVAAAQIYPQLHDAVESVGDEELRELHAFRATLRRELASAACTRELSGGFLAAINAVLRDARPQLERAGSAIQLALQPQRLQQSLRLSIARAAADLALGDDPARLHRCENDRCTLLFVDRTKSGTRRWCTTRCFDQVRARQRRLHAKASV